MGWYLVVNCIAAAQALLFPHHSLLSHVIPLLDIIEVLQCVDKTCRFFPRRCWKCIFFSRCYQLVLFIHSRFSSPAVWWENCRCCKLFPRSHHWSAVGCSDVMLHSIISQMWDIPSWNLWPMLFLCLIFQPVLMGQCMIYKVETLYELLNL